MFLGDYRAGNVEYLVRLLKLANPGQMSHVLKGLELVDPAGSRALEDELSASFDGEESEHRKDERATGIARAGIALVMMGQERRVWPYLSHSGIDEDPRLRTLLIHGMADYAVDPSLLIALFRDATDNSIRRAGLMALGGYSEREFSPELRDRFKVLLEDAFRDDPDGGIHSLVEWLLRKWKYDDRIVRMTNGLKIKSGDLPPDISHYINSEGHTMIVFEGPVVFPMGSPESDPKRRKDETYHQRRIPRTFAIATRHVTAGQFREITLEIPELRRDDELVQADDEAPAQLRAFLGCLGLLQLAVQKGGHPRRSMVLREARGQGFPRRS